MASKKHQNGQESQDQSTADGSDYTATPPASESATASAPQGKLEQVSLPKKIVAKDIVPRKSLIYKKDDDGKVVDDAPRALYRVFGTAQGTEHGDSQYGPWVGFTGSFEAIRFSDRARFKSNRLFLQDPAEGLLVQALADLQKSDPGASVVFAFDVGVKVSQRWIDTDQGNTYEYTIESQLSVAQNDPLAAIRGQMMQNLPQLAGPTSST